MLRRFKVILEWDSEDKAYYVTVPDLPGCMTSGATREIALKNVKETIEAYLKTFEGDVSEIPQTLSDTTKICPECENPECIYCKTSDIEITEVQINYA